jgi:hypothetical protein
MVVKLMAAVVACAAALSNCAVAQANPTLPMPVIEDSARQFCGALNANPTTDGVGDGMNLIYDSGLDDTDGALVTIVAIHHTCPQHEDLILGVFDQVVAEEVCGKPL